MIAVLLLAFWPNRMDVIAHANHEAKLELIAIQGKVKEVAELIKNDKQISTDLKKQFLEELTKLQQELTKAKSLETGAEALAKTQKELTTRLGKDEEKQKLDKLAFRLQQSPTTKGAGVALQERDALDFRRQMEDLEKKLKEMDPSEREQLAKFLDEMAKSLEKTGDPKQAGELQKVSQAVGSSGQAGAEAMANLSDQLSQQLASGEAATRLAGIMTKGLNDAKGKMLAKANHLGSGIPSGASNGSANSSGTSSVASNDTGKSGNQSGNGNGNNGGNSNGNGNGAGSGGSGSASGSGSNGSSSGGSGAGGGSGGGSGGGKSGNDAGNGSSNQTSGLNGKTQVGGPSSSGLSGNGNSSEGHWDKVYVPSGRVGNGGQESRVSGSAGDNTGDSTMVDTANGLAKGGSLLPYSEVLTQYEAEARESMDKEYVPDNLKALVRSYFLDLGQ